MACSPLAPARGCRGQSFYGWGGRERPVALLSPFAGAGFFKKKIKFLRVALGLFDFLLARASLRGYCPLLWLRIGNVQYGFGA
jgi:hypothetical protein